MAQTVTCPEIKDVLAANECLENFGGLGVNVYAFNKAELAAPLKAEKNIYPALTSESFKSGKGLYKFVSWSNGSTAKKIQLTATGMNMGLTAFFKKNG